MRRQNLRVRTLLTAALAVVILLLTGRTPAAGPPGEFPVLGPPPMELPPFDDVEKIVQKHFASLPDYQNGDIIARGDVKPLFTRFERIGWKVADRKALMASVLAEGSFLVRNLRTAGGREFMRQIASLPSGYDRIERLARLPRGEATVQALIRGPDGHKMIDYMTTTPGGENLGKQLSRTPKGKDFNDPTGRIYTVKDLLTRLKQSYDKAGQPAGPGAGAKTTLF